MTESDSFREKIKQHYLGQLGNCYHSPLGPVQQAWLAQQQQFYGNQLEQFQDLMAEQMRQSQLQRPPVIQTPGPRPEPLPVSFWTPARVDKAKGLFASAAIIAIILLYKLNVL